MSQPRTHVAVIGAGIVGLSAAIWLLRAGHRVTLIDREGPGAGASFGNGGVLASIAVVPVATPGIWRKAPAMVLNRDAPLFLRWAYVPKLLPFLRKYLAASAPDQVAKTADALAALLHDAPEQHRALAQRTAADAYIGPGAYLYVYPDHDAYVQDKNAWDLRRARGFTFEELSRDDLGTFDPTLQGRFGFGVLSRQSGVIRDPGAYLDALYAHFIDAGGVFARHEVSGFDAAGDLATGIQSATGTVQADAFVLATGAWSKDLAATLGIKVPLESERGYHIDFHAPNLSLKAPVMIAASKFVVTPLNGRLRAAGVIEFGGLNAPPSKPPFDLLHRQVARHFPDLTYTHTTEWMGHRPAPSDSIPIIGASPRFRNVYVGYGHHHIGLTGGPKTGRWLAQMLSGALPNEDMAPFSPHRRA